MSFLAPLFLAGAAGIALPIIFHLIRRSTKEVTPFSSLMFLASSPPRISRRSRLEHILLLVLRCCAIALAAVGFARPFVRHAIPEQSSTANRTILILVDTSASMRRKGVWPAVQDRLEKLSRDNVTASRLALFTFDTQLKPVLTFEEWDATTIGERATFVHNRIAPLTPGWGATHLDTALMRAAEIVSESSNKQLEGLRQVVVISDFQTGARIAGLQGHEWPRGVQVISERVTAQGVNNAGLQLLADGGEDSSSDNSTVRIRVSNDSDSKKEQFQAGWATPNGEFIGRPVDVYVPRGQSRAISLPTLTNNAAANRIVLRGDDESFDNTVFVVPPEKTRTTVLYLGSNTPESDRQPLFFLQRALQETPRRVVRILTPGSSALLTQADLAPATVIVVTRLLNENEAATLHAAMKEGKTVLFAPETSAAAAAFGKLAGESSSVAASESQLANYAMLAQIDFQHPLFVPFADSRFSDFSKIHFWHYRKVDVATFEQARVLARFDNGDPAIIDMAVGKGRILFLASGWHPADSQLALSSKFVPLLYSVLELSGARPPAAQQYFVGGSLPITALDQGAPAACKVLVPDGSSINLPAGETNFTSTLAPGIYEWKSGQANERFAVNLEPSESRTSPMPPDELERLGVPVPQTTPVTMTEKQRALRLQANEIEGRQKLWRWFIVATLAVVATETWLAGRTTRRAMVRQEGAA